MCQQKQLSMATGYHVHCDMAEINASKSKTRQLLGCVNNSTLSLGNIRVSNNLGDFLRIAAVNILGYCLVC